MKDLAEQFLTESEKSRIVESVKNAEKFTSGEIVPMIMSSSYHYPMANVLGGVTLALPIALILTPIIGSMLWMGSGDMWVFMSIFIILFAIGHETVKRSGWLKRIFISKREIEEEVKEAAITNFFLRGLHETRDKTGVLILISVFEHKVWILADSGINEKLSKATWDDIVQTIVKGIKNREQGKSICKAVSQIGDLLKKHFPIKPDDTDELDNLIIGEESV
ncbi:MAG: TPM domain-containing protein [Desulfobacterales bacterium]|nr:TPM domain-containing protein [Desulfobacterales bacterium]